jgi:hypothetical protein
MHENCASAVANHSVSEISSRKVNRCFLEIMATKAKLAEKHSESTKGGICSRNCYIKALEVFIDFAKMPCFHLGQIL